MARYRYPGPDLVLLIEGREMNRGDALELPDEVAARYAVLERVPEEKPAGRRRKEDPEEEVS